MDFKNQYAFYLGFVTMPSGTFYTDKFVSLQVSQYLPFRFKTIRKTYSTLELEYKSVVGKFQKIQKIISLISKF